MRLYRPSRYLVTAIYTVFLISCGGGGGNSSGASNTGNTGPSFAPTTVVNYAFDMTIRRSPGDFSGSDLPPFELSLSHSFGVNDTVYIRTDLYDAWEYSASFNYERLNNQEARVDITIPNSSRHYSIQLVFTSSNVGSWVLRDNEENTLLSGEFYFSKISPPTNHPYLGTVPDREVFTSEITGADYPYRVYLPADYGSSERTYPVVYATDGQWQFWEFSKFIDETNRNIILIAIEQGANNRREIDYIYPGALSYIRFFKEEFMPFIETNFRTNSSERTINGASYGGLLISYFLTDHANTPNFKNYLSADGSYWSNPNALINEEEIGFTNWPGEPTNLYLTGATIRGNSSHVSTYRNRIEEYNLANLSVTHANYVLEHVEIALPSFKDAIADIYPNE